MSDATVDGAAAPGGAVPLAGGGPTGVPDVVEVHDDVLAQACGRLVAEVYGGEGLVAHRPYLDHVVADATTRAREAVVLAVLDGPGPVGTATYAEHGSRYADLAGPGEAEMRMMAVAARARGRGLGRLLTLACARRARAAGLERLVLSSGAEMTAAHALYASLGLRRTPARDWSPGAYACLQTFALDLTG